MSDGIFPGLEAYAKSWADDRKREAALKALDEEEE